MKKHLIDARDFGSALFRFAAFVPLYKAVVACERRDIRLPFTVVHTALKGQRRARGDLNDMCWHYFGA